MTEPHRDVSDPSATALVDDLRRRLREAEATIAALLSGQVDAVVEPHSQSPLLLAKAQTALREERDRAQRFLDTPDVILLALDRNGCITLINRYGCSVLGWSTSELLGRHWGDTCLPVSARPGFAARLAAVTAQGGAALETVVLTRSGAERLIGWRITVLRDDEDSVIGTFSSGADITERQLAAEALRVAEERTRFALEAAGVGIWDLDFATGRLQWSPTLEAQYGLAPGTFAGTFAAFFEHVHPDDRGELRQAYERAAREGSDSHIVTRAVWRDGTIRWLSGHGRFVVDEHGAPVRGIGTSQDVTERRALEAEFQHAQKMEALGRLAGGVAHDFNNLLTIILGFCELIAADLSVDDRHQRDVAAIHHAGTSAATLTRKLLAFSRKEIVELRSIDLNGLLIEMQAILPRLIREDVKVVARLAPGLPPVHADRGQIEQVVMNLAVNARDAMEGCGTLTIETASVDLVGPRPGALRSLAPGTYVTLTMTDTGTGITDDVQACMFEPFFTTKQSGIGTGLGLASVHGVVTRLGGAVTVSSEVGTGSSFTVYLPRYSAEAVAVHPTPGHAGRRPNTQTVLVVEDQEGLLELTRRLLEREGYTVLVAADAEEARRVFDAHPAIDVVLTDVVMPGKSGTDLITELVAVRPGLKVIYMSGYPDAGLAEGGVLVPGIAYLSKPFTAETLGAKLHEVLSS